MEAAQVGLYLRLSRDDGADSQESMSIGNQRAFLLRYAEECGWSAVEIYIDDGYTGTNFQRPDFQRMIEDIEQKKIDTVLTKDLSRLGRDQIGTLYYLQVYFPSKGVRYIAVSEGIDTALGGGSITTPFLAAANDFYTADISRKVRAALDIRKQNGLFIGAAAPLGYQKDPESKGHLLPDLQTAWIVRRIFRDYLCHGSVAGAAKRMTESGVPTPAVCKGKGGGGARFAGVWSDTTVRRILTNPTYAGHLTQNRRRKIGYKVNSSRLLPEKEWITVPNTHEPLVNQADFDRVQELLRIHSYRSGRGEEHLLTGLAYCADCGAPMTYVRESPGRTYMVCQGYRKGGRLKLCTSHSVREDLVLESLCQQLRLLVQPIKEEELGWPGPRDAEQARLARRGKLLERQIEECRQVSASLYRDKATGVLEEDEFVELFTENRGRRACLERQRENCCQRSESETEEEWRQRVRQILRFESLERGVLTELVEKVLIHEDKEIEVQFRFCKPE